jgi:hypothetical protein
MNLICMVCLAVATPSSGAPPETSESKPHPTVTRSTESLDTFVVETWTFDGPGGVADQQGWTVHDRTGNLQEFFHVADATELDGGDFGYLIVLEGQQSLWCGATYATHPELCSYASLPGYGDNWDQAWVSRVFPASGDLGLSYLVQYDNEPGYDRTTIYYRDKDWRWDEIHFFEGQGSSFDSLTVPDSVLTDSTQLMIRFRESGFWNDETGLANLDGAVIFDSITVWDATGTIDFEDFEDEAPGALATTDGDWEARNLWEYVFDGASVVQEDTVSVNTTNLWGFFNGSTEMSCEHPSQPVVPSAIYEATLGCPTWNSCAETFVRNEIRSPVIDLTKDEDGNLIGSWIDELYLEFDVYRDLELNALVFYEWRVREVVDGCGQEWQTDSGTPLYYGASTQWYRHVVDLAQYVSPQAEEVQVALGVGDFCGLFSPTYGDCTCHSHGPLFDNVRVIRAGPVASAVEETPVYTTLGENYPNPFNPSTTIPFTLEARSQVRIDVYDVAGRLVRTLVERVRAGGVVHEVTWDGKDLTGRRVASGVYFVTLTAGAIEQTRKITLLK